jgi:predicted small secreted protein
MKKWTKIALLLITLAAGIVSFSGCQTAEGFGEDMEKAGEKIQEGVN